ncbi:MAG TPA: septum formation initiator family protein [Chitinophagaceae bacterium]|nr:septum formation initiator family protein [Chitinophagaceae bacterium]HNF70879.1 septum formation initiator family protein [Chitinophagaceae bacterium]
MQRIFQILKNKYFLVTTGFLVWIVFFAEFDLISQYRQRRELQEMKKKILFLEGEVKRIQNESSAIRNDTAVLEKYAREKYFMKSPNEEVFVFDTVASAPAK